MELEHREFIYRVQISEDETVELMNLLSQAVFSYSRNINQEELDSVVAWFSKRYSSIKQEG